MDFFTKLKIKIARYLIKSIPVQLEVLKPKNKFRTTALVAQSRIVENEFSSIYDRGCCLGREFVDDKVVKMLSDIQMQEKYLRKRNL